MYATIDIETTGLDRYKDQITWVGIGIAKDEESDLEKIYCFDVRTQKGLSRCLKILCGLRAKKVRTVFQNGKFDALFIEHRMKVRVPIHEDVMLLGTAYDLSAKHGLKEMAKQYLGAEDWDIGKKEKLSGDEEVVKPYLRWDVYYTWELYRFFRENMSPQQVKIYQKILKPAYLMYRDVERNGLYLDLKSMERVKREYLSKEKALLEKLKRYHDINWNSTSQISKALFEIDGMPILKKTPKGQPAASADVLKQLSFKGYEIPAILLEYKDISTRNKMFLSRWEGDCFESRIHPSFSLTNVVSGRTSCSNPNLQQVPRTKDIRGLFCGAPGMILFEADYSQLELRIAAHYAQERTMLEIYHRNGDIHTETAKLFTGGREPTKEERGKAKAVNFGFLYGMMAKKFVEYAFNSYGVRFSQAEAERYRDAFFAKYSRLLPWHKDQEYLCEMQGGVANLFGRFRRLPDIHSSNRWERAGAARRAINTPVQGTGSDLLISAATQINQELKSYGVKIGATVHDSIIGECRIEDKDWVAEEIRRIMLHPKILDDFEVELRVPLDIDIGWGPWGTH